MQTATEKKARTKKGIQIPNEFSEFFSTLELQYSQHLGPLTSLFQGMMTGDSIGKMFCVHMPPGHGKTYCALTGMLWLCLKFKGISIGHCTYNSKQSYTFESKARELLRKVPGIQLCESAHSYKGLPNQVKVGAGAWQFGNGSSIFWTYKDSNFTGNHFHLIVMDDMYGNAADATSQAKNGELIRFVETSVLNRAKSTGQMTTVLFNTRWTHKDLFAHLVKRYGAEDITIPAISEDGEALCPDRHPLAALQKIQLANPAMFEATYQGRPRSQSTQLFKEPVQDPDTKQWSHGYYDPKELPPYEQWQSVFQLSIGIDFAYQKGAQNDYNVVTVLGKHRETGKVYLLELERVQMDAVSFGFHLKEHFQNKYHRPFELQGNGPDGPTVTFLKASPYHLRFNYKPTSDSKYLRAQPISAAWNDGIFLVPDPSKHASFDSPLGDHHNWVPVLVNELIEFTGWGVEDYDDQVDALANGFRPLSRKAQAMGDVPDYMLL